MLVMTKFVHLDFLALAEIEITSTVTKIKIISAYIRFSQSARGNT